jgi:hypothetical protein
MHRQHVDDVRPILTLLVVVAHQHREMATHEEDRDAGRNADARQSVSSFGFAT